MSGSSLNSFLDDGVPAVEPDAPIVADPIVVEPIVNDKVVVEKPAEPAADEETPPPGARVPVAALQAERQQRQDWKEKATRYEGELSALRPQLDEIKTLKAQLAEFQAKLTAPPPAAPEPPPAPEAVPNPAEDPQGFIAYQQRHVAQVLWNERLNQSESMLRDQLGDDEVNAKLEVFKKAAEANPALKAELAKQAHPYKWLYNQAKQIQAMEQVGADPEAFVQKRIAEERAKWEAEMGAAPRAPEVALPTSLAGARNSGARTQAEETVPEFEDIFKRKAR